MWRLVNPPPPSAHLSQCFTLPYCSCQHCSVRMHEGGCLHVTHPSYPTAYPHIMAAPASAPPLTVNPHTGDEISVKVALHIPETDGKDAYVHHRRGRFSNPSLEDIENWLEGSQGYDSGYAMCYEDQDGDSICIFAEQDWEECVYGWRQRDDTVLKLTWTG